MQNMQNATDYIHTLGRFSGAPGLHRIRALLAALSNPQKCLRFVHLAGTNGKGSTAAMAAQILQEAGYRVGLFTSPFLVRFHERIRINGAEISDGDLQRLTDAVAQKAARLDLPAGEQIGAFEFVMAVGMCFFKEQKCEIVVLETGLGGEFDATNAIDPPLVAAITSISLDHTAVLGDTIAAIARTKAGIIKPGSAVVCAAGQQPDALRMIQAACRTQGVPCTVADKAEISACGLDGSQFQYCGKSYRLRLVGRHQVENACTALHIAFALRTRGFTIGDEAIQDGLAHAQIMGRFERIANASLLFLDGAHNPSGMQALRQVVDDCLGDQRLLLVLGMVRDKAAEECVGMIAPRAHAVFACAPADARALASQEMARLAAQHCDTVMDCGTLPEAIAAAARQASPKDCILIAGSLYLVGEAKKIFTARQNAPE